jgi:hypothetical protein
MTRTFNVIIYKNNQNQPKYPLIGKTARYKIKISNNTKKRNNNLKEWKIEEYLKI